MRTGPQLVQFALGGGVGGLAQVFEQPFHLGLGAGHLRGQGHLGPVGVAKASGLLLAQGEDSFDQRTVVAAVFTDTGGPAHVGPVEALAKVAAPAVLQEGPVAGEVEAEQPGPSLGGGLLLSLLASRFGQQAPQALGQTLHLGRVAQLQGPGVGGIEHLVAEAGGEFGQLLAGGIEGLALFTFEAHASQLHVPQLGGQDALLGGIEATLLIQPFQSTVNHRALAGPVTEGHHGRLLAGVGFAQFGVVTDAIEVAHHPPAPAQPLPQPVERIHHDVPGERLTRRQGLLQLPFDGPQAGVEVFQQYRNVLLDLIGRDRREFGQALSGQQGGDGG